MEAGVKVVVEWMRLCWPDAPRDFGALCLPRRVPLVVESGADTGRSYVVRGVVLGAGLASPQMPARLTNARFVVLRRSLKDANHPRSSSHTVAASTGADADHLRRAPIAAFAQFLRALHELRVQVVITTAPVEEDEASALSRMGVQAIGNLDDDEVQHLCAVTGVQPLPSPAHLGGAGTETHVGVAASSQQGAVGGKPMVHLDLTQAVHPRRGAPHVVMLRSPQKGAGDMLRDCLQRAFRTLLAWQRDAAPRSRKLADASRPSHTAHTTSDERGETSARKRGCLAGSKFSRVCIVYIYVYMYICMYVYTCLYE